MQITRNSLETAAGPGDWFTGDVYIDTLATAGEPSTPAAASVHSTPGARTAWHTHPFGQPIYMTDGVRRCQRRGGQIEVIRRGDRDYFEPGEDHWHGAAPDRFMTRLTMQEVDESGSPVIWGEHATDNDYSAEPSTEA
jgi:quercetin dioxygenase-like cupin family protein